MGALAVVLVGAFCDVAFFLFVVFLVAALFVVDFFFVVAFFDVAFFWVAACLVAAFFDVAFFLVAACLVAAFFVAAFFSAVFGAVALVPTPLTGVAPRVDPLGRSGRWLVWRCGGAASPRTTDHEAGMATGDSVRFDDRLMGAR